MPTTDPRTTIMTIVNDHLGNIKKDDGATNAAVLLIWEGGPEALKYLFFSAPAPGPYDVVITFGDPQTSRSARPIQDVPVHFLMRYPLTVTTVDKPLTGVLTSTAVEMQYKVTYALRAAIAVHAQSLPAATPAYTLRIVSDMATHKRVGGLDIWESKHVAEYETDYG